MKFLDFNTEHFSETTTLEKKVSVNQLTKAQTETSLNFYEKYKVSLEL